MQIFNAATLGVPNATNGSFFWWWREKSMQLVWCPTCLTIHELKQFHLSDVPLVWQPKNPTLAFPLQPILIKSFGFICATFLVPCFS